MSFQGSINRLLGITAGALAIFGPKQEKPKVKAKEDLELTKAKTDYYKQKTKSLETNEAYTKEATKFRKQRTKYQKVQNEYKQLKVDELKEKLAKQKEQTNAKAFKSAATSSLQAVAKKVENQNLARQNLNNVASEQSPFVQTDGTTTNIPRSEDIKALEAVQQKAWKRSVLASQNAETMWTQRRQAENSGYGSVENVDNSYAFSGRTSEADLKNFGLTKQQLREWALSESPSEAAEKFEKFAKSKGIDISINSDEYNDMADVGALIERTMRHKEVIDNYRKEEEARIPDDESTYSVWQPEEIDKDALI